VGAGRGGDRADRHREERSDVAIQGNVERPAFRWIAASAFGLLAMTPWGFARHAIPLSVFGC